MFFEVPFVIVLCIIALVIVFKINKIQHVNNDDIPLPELAEKLLLELEKINCLDIELRKNAKNNWNIRFAIYLERKRLTSSKNREYKFKVRVIK